MTAPPLILRANLFDGRRCTQGLNGQAWVWVFLRVFLSAIVGFDEADGIVEVVQLSRAESD